MSWRGWLSIFTSVCAIVVCAGAVRDAIRDPSATNLGLIGLAVIVGVVWMLYDDWLDKSPPTTDNGTKKTK